MSRTLPVLIILLGAALWSCATTVPVEEAEDDPRDGVYLYRVHCSVCHGALTRTSKPGRRPARIRSAIGQNIGGMGALKELQDEDIVMIAEALEMVHPPEDASGEELYDMYCGACHRPTDESDITGSSYTKIKAAMDDVMCNTVNLRFLGDDDLRKIAGSLEPAPSTEQTAREPAARTGFVVARFLTCGGVTDREPVRPAGEFEPGTERVYVFLEAADVERNMYVYFAWYHGGAGAGRDRIKLGKGPRWRTYCYKTIGGNSGDWRVELIGPEGGVAASQEFSVKAADQR